MRQKPFSRLALALFLLTINLSLAGRSHGQTWFTNGPLNGPRWSHTATLLTNGSVLVAGGIIYNVNGDFNDTNGCELYHPAVGTAALADSMQIYRHSHTATLLQDGTVLVAGGGNPSSELFDPASASWVSIADMQANRLAHTATLLPSGKVLVVAGYDDNAGQDLSSAEIYDPASQSWSLTSPMPYATDSIATALLTNGLVLVCGGSDSEGGAISNAVLYDPVSQRWTNTAPLQEARAGHTATLLPDGRVLVEGGNGNNSVEVYNPATRTWSYVAPMNDGRDQSVAVLLSTGEVMVLGDGNPDVELYDPAADTWTLTDPLPVPGYLQAATVLANGSVVVTGGSESEFNGPPLSAIETFGSAGTAPSLTVTASPLTGGLPLNVQFTSPSTDSAGNTVTNWNWDFGDGFTSTAQSPSHLYTNISTYSPTLVAESTFGAAPLTVFGPGTITVTNHTLNVSANPQTGSLPLSVQFSSPSVDSGGNAVTNWNWDFGDGSTSSAQSPSHSYVVPGNFSPALTARSTYSKFPLDVTGLGTITVTNTPNPLFKTLYTFSPAFGANPEPGLVLLGSTLYGTASRGGSSNYGTVFAVNTNGTGFTNLHQFDLNHGAGPSGGLISSGGVLYGTAAAGGSQGGGVVFAVGTNGAGFSNVYNFILDLPTPGESPVCGLALMGGTLYGPTEFGGSRDEGVVFSVNTNGTGFASLHDFSTPSGPNDNMNGDGLFPINRLLLSGSTLYGVTLGGGSSGRGTVFAVDTNNPGSFRVLHYFSDDSSAAGTNNDGASSFSGLVVSSNTLYGTTAAGGTNGNGIIFAINTDGTGFTNLYNFTGGSDGGNPHGELALSGNILYGATPAGGISTNGTLFSLHTDGSAFTTLYNFTGGGDGSAPGGDLLLSNNILYGTTGAGGSGSGTVFSFIIPSQPLLTIIQAGTNVLLTWPASASNYTLQYTLRLGAAASWNTALPSPVLVNGVNTVTNAIAAPARFYRLKM